MVKKSPIRTIFDEKTLAFLAVAEKTESTYLDGEYGGAVFGFLDEQGRIILQEEVLCPEKPEGLWLNPDKSEFFVVTDTDNPQKASALYKGPVPKLPKAEQ